MAAVSRERPIQAFIAMRPVVGFTMVVKRFFCIVVAAGDRAIKFAYLLYTT